MRLCCWNDSAISNSSDYKFGNFTYLAYPSRSRRVLTPCVRGVTRADQAHPGSSSTRRGAHRPPTATTCLLLVRRGIRCSSSSADLPPKRPLARDCGSTGRARAQVTGSLEQRVVRSLTCGRELFQHSREFTFARCTAAVSPRTPAPRRHRHAFSSPEAIHPRLWPLVQIPMFPAWLGSSPRREHPDHRWFADKPLPDKPLLIRRCYRDGCQILGAWLLDSQLIFQLFWLAQ